MNRITLKLIPIIILATLLFSTVPFTHAEQQYIGCTTSSGSGVLLDGNYLYGTNITTDAPTGTWYITSIWACLHNHTTVAGVDGYAKGVVLNSSAQVVESSAAVLIDTESEQTWYQFNLTGTVVLQDDYVIAIITSSGHRIHLHTPTSGTDALLKFYDASNNFGSPADAPDNLQGPLEPSIYAVIDSTEGGGTPAPTATPTASSSDGVTNVIDDFVGYLIPLILFLLPALILGYVSHWQKWLILIGLAIGSGLVYLFLGAQYIWLVILVVIGIGASAYQSSRGG